MRRPIICFRLAADARKMAPPFHNRVRKVRPLVAARARQWAVGVFAALALVSIVGTAPAVAAGFATNPAIIKALAADAYIWGLGPEYIWRFAQYNTIIGAPFNAFKYGQVPAAWNNEATNAGDASVVYINGFVNFDDSPELVLTVPPSRDQYYVVAYIDGYANSVGSIGTRTTPSDVTTSYLLVGPKSPYAHRQTAKVHGYEYPVMASDTNLNWFLIRVLTNTLIDASAPTSVPNVVNNVQKKFALNTLQEFEANGHQPVYPENYDTPPPDQDHRHPSFLHVPGTPAAKAIR